MNMRSKEDETLAESSHKKLIKLQFTFAPLCRCKQIVKQFYEKPVSLFQRTLALDYRRPAEKIVCVEARERFVFSLKYLFGNQYSSTRWKRIKVFGFAVFLEPSLKSVVTFALLENLRVTRSLNINRKGICVYY